MTYYRRARRYWWLTLMLSGCAVMTPFVIPDRQWLVDRVSNVQFTVRKHADERVVLAGSEIEFGLNTRHENLPDTLLHAVVASEDRRLFDRPPLYLPLRSVQAAVHCVGRVLRGTPPSLCPGYSTITQQLVKLSLAPAPRTPARKLRELVLALTMELRFTPEEILTAYLNRVPLGNGVIGVDSAARFYFGKSVSRIDWAEAAMLAATIQRPADNPLSNPAVTLARANRLLEQAHRHGFSDTRRRIPADRAFVRGSAVRRTPYLRHLWHWIRPNVVAALSGRPAGLYKVTTSADAELQVAASLALDRRLDGYVGAPDTPARPEAALVVLAPGGRVLAMIGGGDDSVASRNVNRAVRKRGLHCPPASSTFKLVTYAAALERGLRRDSRVDGSTREYRSVDGATYMPRNVDGRHHGDVRLEDAFTQSQNTTAVNLLFDRIGYDLLFDVAERLGLPLDRQRRELGLAIGQAEICPLELVAAYGVIAHDGRRVTPRGLLEITDASGASVYRKTHAGRGSRVLRKSVSRELAALLRRSVAEGTGRAAATGLEPLDVLGKTGTSDGNRDAWFVGVVDGHVIGVWIGHDYPRRMPGVTGGTLPAIVFNDLVRYMSRHTDRLPEIAR